VVTAWSEHLLAQTVQPAGASASTTDLSVGTLEQGVTRLKGIGDNVVTGLPAAGVGLVVLVLFIVAGRGVQLALRKAGRGRGNPRSRRNLMLAVGRITYALSIVIGALVAAVIIFPNFTPTGMLTSLGVGSLVLGLAFKDVLQNYAAGILLLIAEPFRPGDQVVFGGYEGTVEDVQPRATFIRTYDGRRVVIPNSELFTKSVMVNTAFDKRRIEYDVTIGTGDDIEEAKGFILAAIRATGTAVQDPPPEVLTMELADNGVALRCRWWISPPIIREAFDARDKVLAAIKESLIAHGIDLPYPTHQVLFHDQTEETDGDRNSQREGWPPRAGGNPRPARSARREGDAA
jgi:small conductance mechanosensitive channel